MNPQQKKIAEMIKKRKLIHLELGRRDKYKSMLYKYLSKISLGELEIITKEIADIYEEEDSNKVYAFRPNKPRFIRTQFLKTAGVEG